MTTAIATLAMICALAAVAGMIGLWRRSTARWTHQHFVERLADTRINRNSRWIGELRPEIDRLRRDLEGKP